MLYVGKAKALRKRVASYFRGGRRRRTGAPARCSPRRATSTGWSRRPRREALLLEDNFIKESRPPYNLRLRDDKSYPYIEITLNDEWPRVRFFRGRHVPGNLYFGPYSSAAQGARDAGADRPHLPVPQVPGREARAAERLALPAVLHQALAGAVRRPRLARGVHGGRATRRSTSCAAASARSSATSSARWRPRPRRRSSRRRRCCATGSRPCATCTSARSARIDERRRVRRGRPARRATRAPTCRCSACATAPSSTGRPSTSRTPPGASRPRCSRSSCWSSTGRASAIPPEVVAPLEEARGRGGVLAARRGSSVEVRAAQARPQAPPAGAGAAQRRAGRAGRGPSASRAGARRASRRSSACATALGLERLPLRIECYDISNLGEQHPVGSMVVFEGGVPKKAHYRKFARARRRPARTTSR